PERPNCFRDNQPEIFRSRIRFEGTLEGIQFGKVVCLVPISEFISCQLLTSCQEFPRSGCTRRRSPSEEEDLDDGEAGKDDHHPQREDRGRCPIPAWKAAPY